MKNIFVKKSSTKEKTLFLGVNGQGGSYLADHLLSRSYLVAGVGRQTESKWTPSRPNFSYISDSLEDIAHFYWPMGKVRPDSAES